MNVHPRQRVVPPWPPPKRNAATHTLQPISRPSAIDCYAADVYTPAMDPTISNDQERVFTLSIPPITVSVVVPPQQPGCYLRTAFQLSKFSRMEKCEVLYQYKTQYAASVSHQSNELNVWSTERYLRPLARKSHIKISDCCRQGNYAPSSTVGEMTTVSQVENNPHVLLSPAYAASCRYETKQMVDRHRIYFILFHPVIGSIFWGPKSPIPKTGLFVAGGTYPTLICDGGLKEISAISKRFLRRIDFGIWCLGILDRTLLEVGFGKHWLGYQ
ncbi:hypothetical protein BU17DRAFT_60725 [Hysterangium stoloniferum]|nr:hypothetical protein BU17DRAFT_60725 [Hysterangium stoloniferum]